jgi:hypothetical protein
MVILLAFGKEEFVHVTARVQSYRPGFQNEKK